MLTWYRNAANSLGQAEAQQRFPNVQPKKKDINDRLEEILSVFDDPLFITLIENIYQRCRLYFNSQHTCYILQHVDWKTREVRISITYANRDRAVQVWTKSQVAWKYKKSLPTQQ
jgi:hypothetical protein